MKFKPHLLADGRNHNAAEALIRGQDHERPTLAATIRKDESSLAHPLGDCQENLPFPF